MQMLLVLAMSSLRRLARNVMEPADVVKLKALPGL